LANFTANHPKEISAMASVIRQKQMSVTQNVQSFYFSRTGYVMSRCAT